MAEKDKKSLRSHGRRRRPKPTVTNVNIFALAPPAGPPEAAPTAAEAREPVALPQPEREELYSPSRDLLLRRERRLETLEGELRERALELDRREAELEEKEARFEADVYLREDDLETRERSLDDLERRLDRRESELGSYVARLQGGFLRAEAG